MSPESHHSYSIAFLSSDNRIRCTATTGVEASQWTTFREDQPIPDHSTAMCPSESIGQYNSETLDWSSDSTGLCVASAFSNGSGFLMKWDKQNWLHVTLTVPARLQAYKFGPWTILPQLSMASSQSIIFYYSLAVWTCTKEARLWQRPSTGQIRDPFFLTLGVDGSLGLIGQMIFEELANFKLYRDSKLSFSRNCCCNDVGPGNYFYCLWSWRTLLLPMAFKEQVWITASRWKCLERRNECSTWFIFCCRILILQLECTKATLVSTALVVASKLSTFSLYRSCYLAWKIGLHMQWLRAGFRQRDGRNLPLGLSWRFACYIC